MAEGDPVPDWKETWFEDIDVEWGGPGDYLTYHVTYRMDDDRMVRFYIAQIVVRNGGPPKPIYRVTYEDGEVQVEEFTKDGPVKPVLAPVEIKDVLLAFSQVNSDIWKRKDARRQEYDNGVSN